MRVISVQRNDGYFEGVGRLRLHYRSWEVAEPRAGLLVVHGLFEHSGRYEEFGEVMAGHGFSVFACDLRGHGASDGKRGHARRFDLLLQDLDRFRREVQGLGPMDMPLFIIGHSLGGLIALRYIEEYEAPIDGAVITAPWLGTAVAVPRWQVLLANLLDRIMPAFPFPFRLDPETLSHDPERVADYRDDPRIHDIITPRMFTETSSAIHTALRRGDRIGVNIHFILAGDDRIVDTARSLAFARSLPSHVVSIDVLDGMFHEVLQERDRSAVMAMIHDWITARLEKLPNRQS